MKLPVYYRCPAGLRVALIVEALNDAPDTIRQPEKTLFAQCDDCEKVEYEPVIDSGKIEWVGYCVLENEVRL